MTFDFTMILLLVYIQPKVSTPVLDEVRILRALDHVSNIHANFQMFLIDLIFFNFPRTILIFVLCCYVRVSAISGTSGQCQGNPFPPRKDVR